MNSIKQSFCWWTFKRKEITPELLVRTAAEIGYQGAELVPEEYWQLLRDHGLVIASIDGHHSIEEGLNRVEHHQRIVQELRAKIKLAQQWSIPNLIVFSGSRQGLNDQIGIDITSEGLHLITKEAEEAGVTLVLELLNSKVDHPDYQADHTHWGIEVCKRVNSPAVKLLYDIYHMQIMEGDIIRTIQSYHPFFAHYHTAGNPGRHDIDGSQEIQYRPIMQTIAKTGYDGYIGQEFIPLGDPLVALKTAFDICNIASTDL